MSMNTSSGRSENPPWTASARVFVPMHLQPGTAHSSFARPDSYNLHRDSPALPTGSPTPGSLSGRSGFATMPRAKARRSGTLEGDDELPPTLSIRSAGLEEAEFRPSAPPQPVLVERGYPVIVFGFPPGQTQAVLQHFARMGEIIENSCGNGGNGGAAAIECGRNWLRMTYRVQDSADRAIAQNGHIMPGQYVIGCVRGEPGEYASRMQQSSTNSLLLDDDEVSMIAENSLASVLGDAELPVLPPAEKIEKVEKPVNVLPDRLVPRSMPSQLFRADPVPAKILPEVISTREPTQKGPQTLLQRVTTAASDALFGWNV